MTGIPAHGGGKRFAVEQELISASSRAAVKNIDLSALQGKKVAVFVSMIGDQGSGVMTGGRYSIDALIRGEYQNMPNAISTYGYPTYETTASTASSSLASATTSTSVLNAPSYSKTKQDGVAARAGAGLNVQGLGEYKNETLIQNPQDGSFLSRLIQTVMFLKGVQVVPSEYADVDLFVNVDVFGTIRSRTEYHILNSEQLKSQTKIEYFAIDKATRQVIVPPTVSSFESQYKEKYILWTGPYKTVKTVKSADPLMVDFSDISNNSSISGSLKHILGVTTLATAVLFSPIANAELANDPFIRDGVTDRKNFEPGGKYHLFGSARGTVTNRGEQINIDTLNHLKVGNLDIEQGIIHGEITYHTNFSGQGHTWEVHSPFDEHASRSKSDKNDIIGVSSTAYSIEWTGDLKHPADGYDAPIGGGYPNPTGARDEYTYKVKGIADSVDIELAEQPGIWQRFKNRGTNAWGSLKNIGNAWQKGTTHNPNLNGWGNLAESGNALLEGVGSALNAPWELLGGNDAIQGLGVARDALIMLELNRASPETQLSEVNWLVQGKLGYDGVKESYARWEAENPNAAQLANLGWNSLENILTKGKGKDGKSNISGDKPPIKMNDYLKTDPFGKQLSEYLTKTTRQYDGQSIYTVDKKFGDLKKGDQICLDGLHKDHFEVYDKNGNFKMVMNPDGTKNIQKTAQAGKGRRLPKS